MDGRLVGSRVGGWRRNEGCKFGAGAEANERPALGVRHRRTEHAGPRRLSNTAGRRAVPIVDGRPGQEPPSGTADAPKSRLDPAPPQSVEATMLPSFSPLSDAATPQRWCGEQLQAHCRHGTENVQLETIEYEHPVGSGLFG
jgi:hypothetical protein